MYLIIRKRKDLRPVTSINDELSNLSSHDNVDTTYIWVEHYESKN